MGKAGKAETELAMDGWINADSHTRAWSPPVRTSTGKKVVDVRTPS